MTEEELNKQLNKAFGLEPKIHNPDCNEICMPFILDAKKCFDKCQYKYVDFTLPDNKDKLEDLIISYMGFIAYDRFCDGFRCYYNAESACCDEIPNYPYPWCGKGKTKTEALIDLAIQVSDKLIQQAQKIDWRR